MKRDLFIILILILFFYTFFYSTAFSIDISSFGGGEVDTRGQGFLFLGLEIGQKIKRDLSFRARLVPNYLIYKYKSGERTIKANSPGVYGLLGIKSDTKKTSIGIFGGIEYRNTDLNPDVRDAKVRGDTLAPMIQGEIYHQIFRFTEISLYGSYSSRDNFFYEKGKIKRQVANFDFKKSNIIHLGIEQFYGRNPDFRMFGLGPTFEIYNIPKSLSLTLHTGYKHDKTFGSGIYGGIEFFKAF